MQDVHSRSTEKHKTYTRVGETQDVHSRNRGETQNVHWRGKGKHETYTQEVGGNTRRTLKK